MRAVDIIIKKRDKQELTKKEIEFFVRDLRTGTFPTIKPPPLQWRSCSTA
jgi:thymidine phosphorylase